MDEFVGSNWPNAVKVRIIFWTYMCQLSNGVKTISYTYDSLLNAVNHTISGVNWHSYSYI
jgi:hypothetical protein